MSKKEKYIDDGHTIFNMDVEGLPNRREKRPTVGLTRKERRAMIIAAFQRFLPIVFGVILCFGLAMILIYLWLR